MIFNLLFNKYWMFFFNFCCVCFREDCYTCVMDTLDFLLSTSFTNVTTAANIPSKPGSAVQAANPILTAPQAEQHVCNMV